VLAVRWYLRFGMSYRDVEELLAERGIDVDHVTVHRWVRRFAPLLDDAARFARHRVGDRWFVDETYVKVAGRWVYLYRRSTSMGRSSTCTRRPGGTPRRRTGSSTGREHRRRPANGGRHRPNSDLPARSRSGSARGVAPRRAVCEQPGRSRPRAAETAAASHAQDQDHDRASGTRDGPRLRAEPAPRTLRDRRRPTPQPSTPRGIPRTGHGHLRGFTGLPAAPACAATDSCNRPHSNRCPAGPVGFDGTDRPGGRRRAAMFQS
jgi:DDE domain